MTDHGLVVIVAAVFRVEGIVWALSDESERSGVMLMAVVVLDPGAVAEAPPGVAFFVVARPASGSYH